MKAKTEAEVLKTKLVAYEASNKELKQKNSYLIDSENTTRIKVNRLEKEVEYHTFKVYTNKIITEFETSKAYRKLGGRCRVHRFISIEVLLI